MLLLPIEKRTGLTAKEFQKQYLLPQRPVVYLAADWPATHKWTFGYLKQKYGHLEVPLFGNDFHQSGKGYMNPKLRMPFGELTFR